MRDKTVHKVLESCSCVPSITHKWAQWCNSDLNQLFEFVHCAAIKEYYIKYTLCPVLQCVINVIVHVKGLEG